MFVMASTARAATALVASPTILTRMLTMSDWRNELTPTEASDLQTLEIARAKTREEIDRFSKAIMRLRNTCVLRQRRKRG